MMELLILVPLDPDGGTDNQLVIGINVNDAEARVHVSGNATTSTQRDTPAVLIQSGFSTPEAWNNTPALRVNGHSDVNGISYSYRFVATPNEGNLGAIDGQPGETFEGFVFAGPDNQDSGMISQGDDTVCIMLGGGAPRGDETNYANPALFVGTRRPNKGADAGGAFDEVWGANPQPGTGDNGRVGVNTNRPSARFHVNGNTHGESSESNPAMRVDGATVMKTGSSVPDGMLENSEMTFEITNNTTVTIKVKGSDGTVRTGTITLS